MKKAISILLGLFMTICLNGCSKNETLVITPSDNKTMSKLKISSQHGVDDFDLAFLKQIAANENQIYSPLSIKYALCMLDEAASNKSKEELDSIIGNYVPSTYKNSENLSLANMFAVRDSIAGEVNNDLINTLQTKYNADILVDSFKTPDEINNWISEKTLGMIDNYKDSIDPATEFLLINALAIDMEWKNKIQDYFEFNPAHENISDFVGLYSDKKDQTAPFNNKLVDGVKVLAVSNNYDIVSEIGEDNIRETVKSDLEKSIKENESLLDNFKFFYNYSNEEDIINAYVDDYINKINKNYGYNEQSTDFYYYDDEEIKVFAKDLKEYDGTTFQYVGIMPKNDSLSKYISSLDSTKINTIIENLIDPSTYDYEEGYITKIDGTFPIFSYDYNMDLDSCLKEMGLSSMYEPNSDFNSITSTPVTIKSSHKSLIDFSNDGIKAAAVTEMGGLGAAAIDYDYLFDVPIKEIDLTFDQPFLYLIRNKDTGDIWFVGTLYEAENEIPTFTIYSNTEIKEEPSESSNTLKTINEYTKIKGTGNAQRVDGETWYELEDGGWISGDLYISVE